MNSEVLVTSNYLQLLEPCSGGTLNLPAASGQPPRQAHPRSIAKPRVPGYREATAGAPSHVATVGGCRETPGSAGLAVCPPREFPITAQ